MKNVYGSQKPNQRRHKLTKRKTITFPDELYKAVQEYRAKRIDEGENMSFSKAVRELLKKALEEA